MVAGILARVWAAVGAQDPPFSAVSLKVRHKTLQQCNFSVRKLDYFISVPGVQGRSAPIPCPAASQQTS